MTKVALYLTSIKEYNSNEYTYQQYMLKNIAEKEGWEIFRIYYDTNYNQSKCNGPTFKELLIDAIAGEFEIILCKSQPKLTNEMRIVEKYMNTLFPKLGIRFIVALDYSNAIIHNNQILQ